MKLFNHTIIRRPLFEMNHNKNMPKNESEIESFCKNLYSNSKFREAIYLTSSDLYKEWEKSVKKNKISRDLCYVILKYYIRCYSSPVPFGLFSSHGILNDDVEEEKRVSYLDTSIYYFILQKIPAHYLIENCNFWLNDSFYKAGKDYRYIDYDIQYPVINYTISSLENTSLIEGILDYFSGKKFDFIVFKEFLYEKFEIDEDDAKELMEDLIETKMVISDLFITLNGEDTLIHFLAQINSLKTAQPFAPILEEIAVNMEQIKSNTFNENFDKYEKIHQLLSSLDLDYDRNKTFCTNYIRNIKGHIPHTIKTKLITAMDVLSKICYKDIPLNALENFKYDFYKKYEGNEISILDLFDNDLGIAYGADKNNVMGYSDLIDDIDFEASAVNKTKEEYSSEIANFWKRVFSQKTRSVDLKSYDLSVFGDKKLCKGSSSVIFSYDEDCLTIKKIGGTSATSILARFSYQNQEITDLCNEIVEHENVLYQETLCCEINCLSVIRSGNIQVKHIERPYGINFILQNDKSNIIPLNDIYLKMVYGQFVLFSKKYQKQIIPFFSTAYNFEKYNPPILKFLIDLCKLNHFNDTDINFGDIHLREIDHIPRITYGDKIILQRESWNLSYDKVFQGKPPSVETLLEYMQCIHFPKYILLNEFTEDRMILNTTNEVSIQIMYQELVKRKRIHLIEFYNKVAEKNFYDEFVMSIKSDVRGYNVTQFAENKNLFYHNPEVKRVFYFGDEWIYLKIYTSIYYSDDIITEVFPKLCDKEYIDKWFFLRYNDPDYHVRLRIHLKDITYFSKVIQEINDTFYSSEFTKIIDRLEYGTYKRELERYGFEAIDLCEEFFYYDSAFVSQLLGKLNESYQPIWIYVLKSIDDIFNVFEYDLESRYKLMKDLFYSFWIEFGEDKYIKKTIDVKFRNMKSEISDCIEDQKINKNALALYNNRLKAMKKIRISQPKNISKDDLIDSLIHMNVNRWIKNKPRQHELILYGLLMKYYKMCVGIKLFNTEKK